MGFAGWLALILQNLGMGGGPVAVATPPITELAVAMTYTVNQTVAMTYTVNQTVAMTYTVNQTVRFE